MATAEVRTQIYLPQKLHRALKREARRRGVSMAQLLREGAQIVLRQQPSIVADPLADLVGAASDDSTDLAEHHDRYLYGLEGERSK
jgi:hypothetical protein